MKHLKILLQPVIGVAIFALLLLSCESESDRVIEIERILIVAQIEAVPEGAQYISTIGEEIEYKYRVRLKSLSKNVYYYTNYKHEVGDTLLSSKEFIRQEVDGRSELKEELKVTNEKLDSLTTAHNSMSFQYGLMVDFYEKEIIEKRKEN